MSDESVLRHGIPYRVEKSELMLNFWAGLNEGKLMSTRCKKCNSLHFPPAVKLCPICFGTEMEWIELPLSGTMSTWTKVEAPPEGFFMPYYLASVLVDELDKQILGRYLGENPKSGQRVKIGFEKVEDQSILVFNDE